jgi:hypothetical protein
MPQRPEQADSVPDIKTQMMARDTRRSAISWMIGHIGMTVNGCLDSQRDDIIRLLMRTIMRTEDRQLHDDALHVMCGLVLSAGKSLGPLGDWVVSVLVESLHDFWPATIERIEAIGFVGVFGWVDAFTMREASRVLRVLAGRSEDVRLAVVRALTLLVAGERVEGKECDLVSLARECAESPDGALSEAGREGVALVREMGMGEEPEVGEGEGGSWRVPKAVYDMCDYVDWPPEWADMKPLAWWGRWGYPVSVPFGVQSTRDWVILSALRRRFGGDLSEVLAAAKDVPRMIGVARLLKWAHARTGAQDRWRWACEPMRYERKIRSRRRDREVRWARRLKEME